MGLEKDLAVTVIPFRSIPKFNLSLVTKIIPFKSYKYSTTYS